LRAGKLQIEKRESDTDHIKWLTRFSQDFWSEKKIIDLGCGSGYLCKFALKEGASLACGIDMVEPAGYSDAEGWSFAQENLDAPDWSGSFGKKYSTEFDIVLGLDIIEHLNSPYLFLRNCSQLLKDDGLLVLTTPNINSWERLLKPDNWSGSIDPQHKTLFNLYSLKFLSERADFVTEHLEAPVRSLGALNRVTPPIGGQIFSVFRKKRSGYAM